MTLYDEINVIMELLTERWGSVVITCDGDICAVSHPKGSGKAYEAPTLIEALRLAERKDEQP